MMQSWGVPLFDGFFSLNLTSEFIQFTLQSSNLIYCWRWKHFENAVAEIKKDKYMVCYFVKKNPPLFWELLIICDC